MVVRFKSNFKHFRKFNLLTILLFMFIVFPFTIILSGCGGSSSDNTSKSIITGTLMGGLFPIPDVSVSLYAIGSQMPISRAVTNQNGNFSLSYTKTAAEVYYASADLNQGNLVSFVSNPSKPVTISELSTVQTADSLFETGGNFTASGLISDPNPAAALNYFSQTQTVTPANASTLYQDYMIANAISSCYAPTNQGYIYSGGYTCGGLQNFIYNTTGSLTTGNNFAEYYSYQWVSLNQYNYFNPAVTEYLQQDNTALGANAPYSFEDINAVTDTVSNTLQVKYEDYSPDPPYDNEPNRPYVTIYIGGKPFNLLFDTGATGIMINKSALTADGVKLPDNSSIPIDIFSNHFKDNTTFSGYVSHGTVSIGTSNALKTSSNFPIAVATTDTEFPSGGFIQGDFGMGLSPYDSFGNIQGGKDFTPSIVTMLPGNYNNGFIFKPNNGITFDGSATVSNTGSGLIIFGLNTEPDNIPNRLSLDALNAKSNAIRIIEYIATIFFSNAAPKGYYYAYPLIKSEYGGELTNPASDGGYQYYTFFDTGSTVSLFGTGALTDGINGFSPATDEYDSCGYASLGNNYLYGTLNIDVSLYDDSGSYYQLGAYTGPNFLNVYAYTHIKDNTICSFLSPSADEPLLINGETVDAGPNKMNGQEIIGMPGMYSAYSNGQLVLGYYWQVNPWGVGQILGPPS